MKKIDAGDAARFETLEARRLMAAGGFDPSFAGGRGTVEFTPSAPIRETKVAGDYVYTIEGESFGTWSLVRRPLSNPAAAATLDTASIGQNQNLGDLFVLRDGSVITSAYAGGGMGESSEVYRRTLPAGGRDTSFPALRSYRSPLGQFRSTTFEPAFQEADGSIVFFGGDIEHNGLDPALDVGRNVVARLRPDNTFDTFGGKLNLSLNSDPALEGYRFDTVAGHRFFGDGVVALPDGDLLFFGYVQDGDESTRRWAVLRTTRALEPRATFGAGGIVIGDDEAFTTTATDAQVDADGRMIVQLFLGNPSPVRHRVLRLTPGGEVDVSYTPRDDGDVVGPYVALVQPDGQSVDFELDQPLVRYRADGRLDDAYAGVDLGSSTIVGRTAAYDVVVADQRQVSGKNVMRLRAIDSALPAIPGDGVTRLSGGDFDGDGKDDIFTFDPATGHTSVWFMDGNERVGERSLITVAGAGWRPVGVAQLDAGPQPEVLWRNEQTGANLYWHVNDGEIVSGVTMLPRVADTDWQLRGAMVPRPGVDPHLVWHHRTTRSVLLWRVRSSTQFDVIQLGRSGDDWEIAAIGDVTGDDRDELLWHSRRYQQTLAWSFNNALVPSIAASVRAAAPWAPTGLGDLDGDGDNEILWRNPATGGHLAWTHELLQRQDVLILPRW